MQETSTFFRTGVVIGASILVLSAAIGWTSKMLPDDARNLASRLMEPLVSGTAVDDTEVTGDYAETDTVPSARIRAVSLEPRKTSPETETHPDGAGLARPEEETVTETVSSEDAATNDEAFEPDSTSENVGNSDGIRAAIPELRGLTRSVLEQLLLTGEAALVAELADGREFVLSPEHAASGSTHVFVPWIYFSADYSQWQVVLPETSELLPVPALRLALLKAAGPSLVRNFALVLSASTEEALYTAQDEFLRSAGMESDRLLAEGHTILTQGCWQDRDPVIQITAAAVDGRHIAGSVRGGC